MVGRNLHPGAVVPEPEAGGAAPAPPARRVVSCIVAADLSHGDTDVPTQQWTESGMGGGAAVGVMNIQ